MPGKTTQERVWNGASLLEAYLVPVGDLTDHSENARQGDVLALVGSLQRWGQIRPILVDTDMTIVAGHHLRKAAVEMGWTHVAVIPHQFQDEDSRRAYLIADNNLAQLGGYDEQAQMSLVDSLEASGNLEGTGLTSDHVEDMRAAFAVPTIDAPAVARVHAETPEAQEARAQALAMASAKKDVVMMMDVAVYDAFAKDCQVLSKAYGLSSATDTIVRCIHEAADAERAK